MKIFSGVLSFVFLGVATLYQVAGDHGQSSFWMGLAIINAIAAFSSM